ncbi:MAG: hypothetical protein IJ486_03770 [Firmicutes bacterium]|nr:hypothetical protein [Bacillota bacterium]
MKKRFLLMMLAGVLAFSMIGCGGGDTEVEEPNTGDEIVDTEGEGDAEGGAEGGVVIDKAFADMTLEEMILASYAGIELPMTGEMEIDQTDAETVAFYLGTNDVTFKRGVVSEAMISSIAHSVVVLEMEDAAAAEAAAATLKETAPVGKWVCVVPEQSGTAFRDNFVMMAMSNSADAILANFSALQ